MDLFKIGFITVKLFDIIDIFIVSLILFELYEVFKRNFSTKLLWAILVLFLTWSIVEWLNLKLFKAILDKFVEIGALVFVVLFAPEIRRFLLSFGNSSILGAFRMIDKGKNEFNYNEFIEALFELAAEKTGAIVVLAGTNDLRKYEKTGEYINSTISKRLLHTIFFKNSPLHDGALIVKNNQIIAARCVLPISENPKLPLELGMRHISAVGMTEVSDSLAIVVSEQTGVVSYAKEGKLVRNLTKTALLEVLKKFMNDTEIVFEPDTKNARNQLPVT